MAKAKKLWIFSVFDNPKPVRGVSRPRPLSAVSQGFHRLAPWLTFGDHFWDDFYVLENHCSCSIF
jgi:hypothetical protein